MSTFERHHVAQVLALLAEPEPMPIVAVVGPRQTGKTTLVRQALKRARVPAWHIAVDDRAVLNGGLWPNGGRRDAEWLARVWEAAREEARMSERGFVLALDEVQHVKDWSRLVKGLWDRDRAEQLPLRVVVLGSAPWDMLTGISESLVGRFMPVHVRQWSLREMVAAFGLSVEEYLLFGGYPRAARWRHDWAAWHRYIVETIVEPTVNRDILGLTRVDKPALMRRLMQLIPRCSGQILSYNKMLGQLQDAGNTTTLARYLDLLGNAGLATGLSQYSDQPHAGRASSPKLNVLDPAIMTSALGYHPKEAQRDRALWGRIVESAVGAHLHNTLPAAGKLHYWRQRHRGGVREVDFVLARGPRVLGVEVKSGGTGGITKNFEAFRERFPKARTLLVVPPGGRQPQQGARDGRVPLDQFLWESASYWLEEA